MQVVPVFLQGEEPERVHLACGGGVVGDVLEELDQSPDEEPVCLLAQGEPPLESVPNGFGDRRDVALAPHPDRGELGNDGVPSATGWSAQ